MPDFRIAELTKTWCEVLYKGKYGFNYPTWTGKDAKLLQRLLATTDASFGKIEAPFQVEDAMKKYLDDTSGYYTQDKHPFGAFCAKVQRWLASPPKPKPKVEVKLEMPKKLGDFEDECAKMMVKDPVKFMKGFAKTGALLKKVSPEKYAFVRSYIVDLLGAKRATEIWNEMQSKELVDVMPKA